jgi:hypothetical protein
MKQQMRCSLPSLMLRKPTRLTSISLATFAAGAASRDKSVDAGANACGVGLLACSAH